MNELVLKTIRCAVRTVGFLALVALLIWGAKYLELKYEDARAILGIINAYGPELSGIFLFGSIGLAFYKASANKDVPFSFIGFFRSDGQENVGKLIYFLLGVTVVWSYFALFWREKLDAGYVIGTGFLIIVQGVAAIGGKTIERIKGIPTNQGDEK
jgi:hypothetical protein